MPSRAKFYFAAAVTGIALALGIFAYLHAGRPPAALVTGEALVGGPFTLVNQRGERVSEKTFLGSYMLIFFGFTYCPDVCPTQLQVMTAALDMMPDKGEGITPIFISIDPERDTPETIKAYVENFSPRLVGLTGTPAEVAAAAKAYRVYYKKAGNTSGTDYLMDHSSIIYLMDREGRFLKHFTYTTDAGKLAEALAGLTSGSP